MSFLAGSSFSLVVPALAMALVGASAYAQDATPTPPEAPATTTPTPEVKPSAPGTKAERISVVGSRIKRADVETSSPQVVISRQQIEATGVTTVGELLRTQAVASTGNFAGESGYVRSGSSTGNLYGLGSGRTLVLVDGQRLPKDASLGGTNLSVIPASMIERMEILTGSRSAIYGSDAIAGVINIVTRKDFEGTEVHTSIKVPENGGGERQELNVSYGQNFGQGGNFILSAGSARENRIYEKNRDISPGEGKFASSASYAPAGTYNYRLVEPSTGLPVDGKWQPSSNCPAGSTNDQRGPGEPDRGVFCVGDIKANSSEELKPSTQSAFLSSKLEYDVSSNQHLSGFLAYSQQKSRSNRGNFFSNVNYLLPGRYQLLSAARAQELGIDSQGLDVELRQINLEAPDRITVNLDRSYGGFVSLDGQMGESWNTSVSLTHYITRNDRDVENVIDREAYARTILGYTGDDATGKSVFSGNPAYIPIDPNRNPALLASVVDTMSAAEVNALTAVTFNAGRDLIDLAGGKLAMNLGLDVRGETFKQTPDAADLNFFKNQPQFTGTESTSGKGHRDVVSAYAEVLAPVLPSLTFDAALRFDNYSDFGTASNFNLGAKWKALNFLTLRANTGTSYRAPELNYLHQKGGGGYLSFRDDVWCEARTQQGTPCVAGERNSVFVDRPGNKELDSERAVSYVVGAIFEPTPDAYFSIDYAAFKIRDVFNLKDIQDVVDEYYSGQDIGPASVTIDPQGKFITAVKNPWRNIGQELTYLLQMEGGYTYKIGGTTLGYKTDATRTLSRKEEKTDGTMKQYNGIEANPKWRWNNRISAGVDSYTFNLSSATIAKQVPDPENVDTYKASYYNDSVPEFTRYDASVEWGYSSEGRLTVGVANLADKIGGLYRSGNYTGAEGTGGSLYSDTWAGRSYFANLTQTF